MSLSEARAEWDELQEAKAKGVAPREALSPTLKPTFASVALEWFEKHVEPVRVEGHARRVRYRLEAFLFPSLGDRPIEEIKIKAPDLLAALRPVEESGAL